MPDHRVRDLIRGAPARGELSLVAPRSGVRIVTRVQAELARRLERDQRAESLGRAYVRQLAELRGARRACTDAIAGHHALDAVAVAELEADRRQLSLAELELRTAVEAFRAQRMVLTARYSTAEAVARIAEAEAAVGDLMAEIGRIVQGALGKADHAREGAGRSGGEGGAPDRPAPGRPGPRGGGSLSPRSV